MREEDFIAELRVELLAAAQRRSETGLPAPAGPATPAEPSAPVNPRRRNRRRFTAVAVAVAAAVTLLVAGVVVSGREDDRRQTVDQTEEPPFQVTTDGDDIIIRLTDQPVDRQEIMDAAAAVGFDLFLLEVPAGPSNVGRIQGISGDEGVVVENLGPNGFQDGVRLNRSASGKIRFTWGRVAQPGESYQNRADALAPGDVLECLPILGDRVADVEDLLSGRGLTVRWFVDPVDAVDAAPDGPEVYSTALIQDWKVAKVESMTTDMIVVTASKDGRYQVPDKTGFHRVEATMPEGC